jgi:NAD-dependent oxidoreductase involved in siderophore biosynthesis
MGRLDREVRATRLQLQLLHYSRRCTQLAHVQARVTAAVTSVAMDLLAVVLAGVWTWDRAGCCQYAHCVARH